MEAGLIKYEFKIDMTCGGCTGAVTRILTKNETYKTVEATWEN